MRSPQRPGCWRRARHKHPRAAVQGWGKSVRLDCGLGAEEGVSDPVATLSGLQLWIWYGQSRAASGGGDHIEIYKLPKFSFFLVSALENVLLSLELQYIGFSSCAIILISYSNEILLAAGVAVRINHHSAQRLHNNYFAHNLSLYTPAVKSWFSVQKDRVFFI